MGASSPLLSNGGSALLSKQRKGDLIKGNLSSIKKTNRLLLTEELVLAALHLSVSPSFNTSPLLSLAGSGAVSFP